MINPFKNILKAFILSTYCIYLRMSGSLGQENKLEGVCVGVGGSIYTQDEKSEITHFLQFKLVEIQIKMRITTYVK